MQGKTGRLDKGSEKNMKAWQAEAGKLETARLRCSPTDPAEACRHQWDQSSRTRNHPSEPGKETSPSSPAFFAGSAG